MKTFSCLAALLLLVSACSGGVDDPNDATDQDRQQGDDGPADNDTQDDDGDTDVGGSDGDGSSPTDDGPVVTCPAAALEAKQFEVYGDSFHGDWFADTFGPPLSTETTNVCTGAKAQKFTNTVEFSGFFFKTSVAGVIPTRHLSARIWVSKTSLWTIAATPDGEDGHCYRLPFPETCGENSPVDCGPDQHAAPCLLTWTSGWNDVELDVPASVGSVRTIFFERQQLAGALGGNVTVIIDDLRLTQP